MVPKSLEPLAKRVLVIDDEPAVVELIVSSLQQSGLPLEIQSTTSGYEGCIRFGRFRPDLVILDLNMPDVDGAEVLRSMKQNGTAKVPKILVASGAMERIREMIRLGCDDYLCKPLHPDELRAKVSCLLELEQRATDPNILDLLLVEDDLGEAQLLHSLLDDSLKVLFRITDTSRLEGALALLQQREFDLILLDLTLPDAQGIETITRTKPASGEVPIVVMAGHDDEELTLNALKAGAQDYLVKGQLDGRNLVRTLCYAVERNRTLLDLEHARQREHFLATHDCLTGLANRALFYDHLQQALTYADRYEQYIAVVYVDLDQFKSVNDRLGHAVGDMLLRNVGQRLAGCIRRSDAAARVGGDEFLLLLQNLTRVEDAAKVADHVLHELSTPHRVEGYELTISASIGISLFPQDGTSADALIRNADAALYSAKEKGKSDYQFYTAGLNARTKERHEIERGLRQAVDLKQLVIHYQPQLDLLGGRIFGAEALVRWNHPELGLIPPCDFIPLAEKSGLISPIVEWVMHAACEQHRAWRDAGLPPIRMAVNLSVQQLRQRHLTEKVKRILDKNDMDPAQLELEITESGILLDSQQSFKTLQSLKQLGVRISIDDFGTGQAAFSYLRRFAADTIKLDRSYVSHLVIDENDTAIAVAILAMANSLQLETIAEGVENLLQLEFLRSCHCDRVQGFLFSRPVPAEEFQELWTREVREGSLCPRSGPTAGVVSPGVLASREH